MFISKEERKWIHESIDEIRDAMFPGKTGLAGIWARFIAGPKPRKESRFDAIEEKINRMDTAIAVRQEHDIGFLKTIGEFKLRLDGLGRGFDILKARMDARKKNEVALFKRVAALEKIVCPDSPMSDVIVKFDENLRIRDGKIDILMEADAKTQEQIKDLKATIHAVDEKIERFVESFQGQDDTMRKCPSAKRPARKR